MSLYEQAVTHVIFYCGKSQKPLTHVLLATWQVRHGAPVLLGLASHPTTQPWDFASREYLGSRTYSGMVIWAVGGAKSTHGTGRNSEPKCALGKDCGVDQGKNGGLQMVVVSIQAVSLAAVASILNPVWCRRMAVWESS